MHSRCCTHARGAPILGVHVQLSPVLRAPQERSMLALEEWVREGQDHLFVESAALKEVYARQGLHMTRCAFYEGSLHQI